MNNTSYLVIDIETIPNQDLPEELKPKCKLGNLIDSKKIKIKQIKYTKEGGQDKAMSLDPAMNQIVCIEMWSSKINNFVERDITSYNEYYNLSLFWDTVMSCDLIVGKNHINFDIPTILFRSMALNIKPTRNFSLRRYSNYPLYDIQEILCNWQPDKRKSLDWLQQRFIMDRVWHINGNGDILNGSTVYDFWKKGFFNKISEYCEQDVLITKQIFERMIDYYPSKQDKK